MAESTVADNPTAPVIPITGEAAPVAPTKAEPAQDAAVQSDKPAAKGETTGQPEFDVRKSYDELRKQFTKVTTDYSRDRKTWNQTLSELQTLKQSHGQLAQLLTKATKAPVNPEQFMRELQSQGPEALTAHVKELIQAETAQMQEAYTEQANRALLLEAQLEKLYRRQDAENYPDFKQLEPVMQEIADSENCPIDWGQPTAVIYDTLYKLARSRSSEDAVKAAEEFGRKTAEHQLGKEAATAVPGGGKAGAPLDPSKIKDISKLREYFVSQLGEAE
jgi:hypothetical protein